MKTTIETIKQKNKRTKEQKNIHLVISFVADKEWKKMIKIISKLKPKSIACTKNTINPFRKVVNPKNIAQEFKNPSRRWAGSRSLSGKTKTEIFLDPRDALTWSRKQTKKDGIILVTGSLFLSGELRADLTSSK